MISIYEDCSHHMCIADGSELKKLQNVCISQLRRAKALTPTDIYKDMLGNNC